MANVQKDPQNRRRVDPMVIAVNALGIHTDYGVGHELLLSRRPGQTHSHR